IGAIEAVPPTSLVTAILPIGRAGEVGGASLTALASVINAGNAPAFNVGIEPVAQSFALPVGEEGARAFAQQVPAAVHFQTTNPATNAVTGTPDTGADILPGQVQTYVIIIRPTAPFAPTQLAFDFEGPNSGPAPVVVGLNTLLTSAATSPIADIVA